MTARSLAMSIGWAFGTVGSDTASDTGPPDDGEPEPTFSRGCVVYSAANLYEAQLVLDLLDEAGVGAKLFNQHLVGALGELPLGESLPKIWLLDESNWNAARDVIEAYEARRKQTPTGMRHCHACEEESPGNFELCWSCREPFEGEGVS